jgi:hypothetical protein
LSQQQTGTKVSGERMVGPMTSGVPKMLKKVIGERTVQKSTTIVCGQV